MWKGVKELGDKLEEGVRLRMFLFLICFVLNWGYLNLFYVDGIDLIEKKKIEV